LCQLGNLVSLIADRNEKGHRAVRATGTGIGTAGDDGPGDGHHHHHYQDEKKEGLETQQGYQCPRDIYRECLAEVVFGGMKGYQGSSHSGIVVDLLLLLPLQRRKYNTGERGFAINNSLEEEGDGGDFFAKMTSLFDLSELGSLD